MGKHRLAKGVALALMASALVPAVHSTRAAAAPVSFPAEADAKVDSASPNTNFGTATTLRADSPNAESYLRFTVSGLSGGVQSAVVRLVSTSDSNTSNGPRIVLTAPTPVWSETGITYNSGRPADTGDTLFDSGSIGTNTAVNFNVSGVVTGNGTYSFHLIPTSTDGITFHSRESSSTSSRPQLIVTPSAGSDTTPPDTVIDTGPSGTVSTTSASFTFHSTEANSNFECRLDTPLFTPCESGITYSGLANGTHTFEVRAIDAAGNADPDPASRTWTINANPPGTPQSFPAVADARVDSNNPNTNYGTSTILRADSPNAESYLRFTVSGLSGGVQSAVVRLRSTSSTTTTNGPRIVLTAPTPIWSETGITYNSGRPADVGDTLSDTAGIASNTTVDFNVSGVVTGNGTYSFHLIPTSTDGVDFHSREASSSSNRPQLIVTPSGGPDMTPPNTIIDSGPSGIVSTTSATFAFHSTEANSTFQCSLDGEAFATCTSPVSYSGFLNGSTHTFEVQAIDAVGNVDASPDSRTWTIDTSGGGAQTMAGAGDISGCSSSGDSATASLLASIPGSVFTLGDNVYPDGTSSQFTNCYHPTWGAHKPRTKPTTGNHDYNTSGASGYYGYFGSVANGPHGYYSYDLGNSWHVIVLNSNCSKVTGGCGAGSAQEQWLKADLMANTKPCTVAMWHHPRFSSGSNHGSSTATAAFWNALYQFGAEIVLGGHDHLYERFAPQTPGAVANPSFGIRQFTVGTGGISHYSFSTPIANSQVRSTGTFGVLKLTLDAASYNWQFVPQAGKTFTDSGTTSCHAAP